MDLRNEIVAIVKNLIDNIEIFLVDVNLKGKIGNQKIQVFIDGDNYVDVDVCSKISRGLSKKLEERDIIEGRYVIEVSSPGAETPLAIPRQYHKHIGRELEVIAKENKKYQGTLKDVTESKIELSIKSSKLKKEINSETLKLSFEDIDSAKVMVRL